MHKDVNINVSVGIVALNEEGYVGKLLDDIVSQTYQKKYIELLLIDSCSTDGTKKMFFDFAEKYKNEYYSIKILSNDKIKQASGWNLAISLFTGNALLRLDAHARIPENFIQNNVNYLKAGEKVVGGVRPAVCEKNTLWSKTLLIAEESMFGSSIASYRRNNEEKYTNSMFHACYSREVLNVVGGFNEYLGRTEDNEFHYRIRKSGFKLYYNPRIISYQIIRNGLKKMIKQKFGNGFWIGLTVFVSPCCLSIYHFAPFLFVLCMIVFLNFSFLFISLISVYFLFVIINSAISLFNKHANITTLFLIVIFPLLHISYGIGTLLGLTYGIIWPQRGKAKEFVKEEVNHA